MAQVGRLGGLRGERRVEQHAAVRAAASGAAHLGADATAGPTWRCWGIAFDARLVQLVVASVVLLIATYDNAFLAISYHRFVFQFVVPVLIVVGLWREDPRRYGLGLGDWRLGVPIALGGIAVMAVAILFVGRWPEFVAYYGASTATLGRTAPQLAFDLGIELLAWEFFCRGWLLNALGRRFGADAIWLQVIPFALMHLAKPEIEALSTIVGGAVFGIVAWKTRSCLYGFLVHWFMMFFVIVVAAGWL